jgi:hypothetical protein
MRGWEKSEGSNLDQIREFFDCHSQVSNYASQRPGLDGNTTVHGNGKPGMVSRTHVDGMVTRLSPELKPQALSDAGHIFTSDDG